MECQICSLSNEQLIAAIEQKLSEGNGYLTIQAKNQLIKAWKVFVLCVCASTQRCFER